MADNSKEKLMRETARVILQTVYDCPENERNEKILWLAKGFGVKINNPKELPYENGYGENLK